MLRNKPSSTTCGLKVLNWFNFWATKQRLFICLCLKVSYQVVLWESECQIRDIEDLQIRWIPCLFSLFLFLCFFFSLSVEMDVVWGTRKTIGDNGELAFSTKKTGCDLGGFITVHKFCGFQFFQNSGLINETRVQWDSGPTNWV